MPAAPQTSKTSLITGVPFRMLVAVALFAVAAVGGAGDATQPLQKPATLSATAKSESIVAVPVAPKTWSSRSQVRWDARFGAKGCYVV